MRFFLELRESIIISLKSIRANLMRSILTTVGIIIGILSVTIMGTAIEGLKQAFTRSISSIGAEVLYIQNWPWFAGNDWWKYRNRKIIKLDEGNMLIRKSNSVEKSCCFMGINGKTVKHDKYNIENINIVGSDNNYAEINGYSMEYGRFLSQAEAKGGRPVCVLGWNVYNSLFDKSFPINDYISLRGYKFKVVGVLEKQGSFLGIISVDNRVIIPYQKFYELYGKKRSTTILIKPKATFNTEDAKEEIRGQMRKVRKLKPYQDDDFAINEQEQIKKTFGQIGVIIAAVGLLITGLSLFVGGIGIMNIMYVSVTERTREIGLRKALGARNKTILLQFLIETITICILGGIIGLLIAFPISLVIDQLLPTAMPTYIIIIAIIISVITGVISGFMPAYKASRLNPVEALRFE